MKRTTKRKIEKIALTVGQEILWALKDFGEMIPYPFEGPGQHLRRLREYDRYKVSRSLWELSRQGLVKKAKRERKVYYYLTDLGRAKSLRYIYAKRPKVSKVNGLSTIVIFDIPEQKRKARQFLRRFLIQNGFTMLQRSVFIGRWEIQPEFKELLKELKIDLDVSVIEGRVLHN